MSAQAPNRGLLLSGAAATALCTMFFMLLFWNHFLGMRSGDGGYSAGVFLLNGVLPYRDYYCPVTPVFIARSALVMHVFGKLPIVLRATGVAERVAISLVLYFWLARFFRVKDAAMAAVVTMIVSSGDYADPVSSYNHFTVLLALLAGFVASYAMDSERQPKATLLLGATSGFFALLCFACKQTIGLGMLVAVPAAVGLVRARAGRIREALSFVVGFLAGCASSAALFVECLRHYGLLAPFLHQVFVEGPAAKASRPGDFVAHAWMVLRDQYWWAACIAVPILFIWGVSVLRAREREVQSSGPSEVVESFAAIAGCTFALLIAAHLPIAGNLGLVAKPFIYAVFGGTGLLLTWYSWLLLRGTLAEKQAQLGLLTAVSFVVAFMTSLSFPAFELMLLPGLSLILAVLSNEYVGWRRGALYAVCALLVFCEAEAKVQLPFGFDGWFEPPVTVANGSSTLPVLRGLQLAPNTSNFVDTTVGIIRENSQSSDTIFVYPEIGILYGLTERRCATLSCSHNMDTVSDVFAKQEAQRLLRARPAVVVYAPTAPSLLRVDEEFWRGGRPSGQRDLIAATESLTEQYRLAWATRLYPYGDPVYVFVRP